MKLSFKGENGLLIKAEQPDERIQADMAQRLRNALVNEQNAFLEEVRVAMRKLRPGQKRVMLSKRIRVELESFYDGQNTAQRAEGASLKDNGIVEVLSELRAGDNASFK